MGCNPAYATLGRRRKTAKAHYKHAIPCFQDVCDCWQAQVLEPPQSVYSQVQIVCSGAVGTAMLIMRLFKCSSADELVFCEIQVSLQRVIVPK